MSAAGHKNGGWGLPGDKSFSYHRRNPKLLLGAAGSGWSTGRAVGQGTVWFKQSLIAMEHLFPRAVGLLLFLVTHRVLLHPLGQLSGKQVLSATSDERVKDEFSDLSEG